MTILINCEIIGVAILIWIVNHFLETKELAKIEKEIEEEINCPVQEPPKSMEE